MIRNIVPTLIILLFLGSAPITQASVLSNSNFTVLDLQSGINFFESQSDRLQAGLVKTGVSYDESKDPALRTGTQNWEEPQGSFFIVPALLLGVFALILFFKRN